MRLFRVASLAVACVTASLSSGPAQAQSYAVLYSFVGAPDGAYPEAGVIQDAKGNIYGTTMGGGETGCPYGCGVVFELSASGEETILHRFTGGADGGVPLAGLIQDDEGNLYGTTSIGGAYHGGTVFKLTKTGHETVLHSFGSAGDGAYPYAGLIRDSKGNFYGTTDSGGAYGGYGTVFKLSKTGKETVLYSFCGQSGCPDGLNPIGGVVRDASGNLYGTTSQGGTQSQGVVFKLSMSGQETVLYSFTGGADGGFPYAGVLRDSDGILYGTAERGGNLSCDEGSTGCGVVFELNKAGKETVLHTFCPDYPTCADGATPLAGLIVDSAGNLYGTTLSGGTGLKACGTGCGTVFRLSKTADETARYKETVLYQFCTEGYPCTDGIAPYAGLMRDYEGNLYGTAFEGGTSAYDGTVFKITP